MISPASRLLPKGNTKWRLTVYLLATVAMVAATIVLMSMFRGGLSAQSGGFDSRSDGSDGALVLTEPGSVVFDPRTFNPPLDQDGDNVYNFTSIQIGAGVTVVLSEPILHGPVYWLATQDVQIDGAIELSGGDGHPDNSIRSDRRPSVPGAGGYAGGVGHLFGSLTSSGFGPGGGRAGVSTRDQERGGGGSYATLGQFGNGVYGNIFLVPLLGGSGGGACFNNGRGCTGPGGGALLIASGSTVTINGDIRANGGNSGGFLSGAGSGGAIHILGETIEGNGTLATLAGNASVPGGIGRIRLDAHNQNFTGSVSGSTTYGAPFLLLPTDTPSLRIISVDGQPVPDVPTASFEFPDTTVDNSSPLPVGLEARNIPPNTVVRVLVFSENGLDQVVDNTPLVGTPALSTATADVTFPFGFTRIMVEANWTP